MTFTQSAYGELPYTFDWADWLAGDSIASVTCVVESPLVNPAVSFTTTTVTVWINSQECAVGDNHKFRHVITTAQGLIEAFTAHLSVVE